MWFPPSRRPYRRSMLWRTRRMFRKLESHRRRQELLRCSCGSHQDLRRRQQRHGRCRQLGRRHSGTRASSRAAWRRGGSSPRRSHQRGLPWVRARREHLPMWFALCRRRRVRPRRRSAKPTWIRCSNRRGAPSAGRWLTQPITARLLRPARQCHMRRRPRARQRQLLRREEQAALPCSIRKRDMLRQHRALVQPFRGAQCLWLIARCQRPQLNR